MGELFRGTPNSSSAKQTISTLERNAWERPTAYCIKYTEFVNALNHETLPNPKTISGIRQGKLTIGNDLVYIYITKNSKYSVMPNNASSCAMLNGPIAKTLFRSGYTWTVCRPYVSGCVLSVRRSVQISTSILRNCTRTVFHLKWNIYRSRHSCVQPRTWEVSRKRALVNKNKI